jgi:hypothetical protein
MHAIAVVLMPPGESDIESYLERILEPYSEHREVPEYEKECWCMEFTGSEYMRDRLAEEGQPARHKAEIENLREQFREVEREAIEVARSIEPGSFEEGYVYTTVGNTVDVVIDVLERDFEAKAAPMPVSRYSPGMIELERERRRRGDRQVKSGLVIPARLLDLRARDKAIADQWYATHDGYDALREKHRKAAPDYGKPDPECETCHGSGIEKATFNPRGYWDWYVVGGRWTNFFGGDSEYDPLQDPRNWEVCWLCAGSGYRMDRLGIEARADNPSYTCNGCSHEPGPPGMKLKFAPDFVQVGNTTSGERWLRLLETKGRDQNATVPAAVVTPDGEWHEPRERWSRNKQVEIDWRATVRRLARENKTATAIAVDYHH